MEKTLEEAQILTGHCPACFHSLKMMSCTLGCSPDQAQFNGIVRTHKTELGDAIDEMDIYISEELAQGLYNSCKDVTWSMANAPIWTVVFSDAIIENYKDLLYYMGLSIDDGGMSPYSINFKTELIPGKIAAHAETYQCDNPDYFCGCADCKKSCGEPIEWLPIWKNCKLFSMNCALLISILVYPIALLAFIVIFVSTKKALPEFTRFEEVARTTPRMRTFFVDKFIRKMFYRHGKFVATYPKSVIVVCMLISLGFSVALAFNRFQVEKDPIALWVGVDSEVLHEKNSFDNTFNPFYRTEQIILTHIKDGKPASVFEKAFIHNLFLIIDEISKIQVNGVTIEDLCHRFMPEHCGINSVTNTWKDLEEFEKSETWKEDLFKCISTPFNEDCLANGKPPLIPEVVLGGFDIKDGNPNFKTATALNITILLKNHVKKELLVNPILFERKLVEYFKTLRNDPRLDLESIRISFSTASALEDEIDRGSFADLPVIILSYIVMFFYVAFSLKSHSSNQSFWVSSRFGLSFGAILIVLLSMIISVSTFSMFGAKINMIMAEVIPFLVLAVGVDNVFLLVHVFDHASASIPIPERIASSLSSIGPNILLTAMTETISFSLGSMVTMPAVSVFSEHAALALFVSFLLQMTFFVALMSLDSQRMIESRLDLFPFIKLRQEEESFEDPKPLWLNNLVSKRIAPFMLRTRTKITVGFLYLCLLVFAGCGIFSFKLGLDQKLAVPKDSFLIPYFEDIESVLRVGPPLYFVLQDFDVSTLSGKKHVAGRAFRDLDTNSISAMLEVNRVHEHSFIARPTAVWLEDYFEWLKACCKMFPNKEYDPDRLPGSKHCQKETRYLNETLEGEDFMRYLPHFLEESPNIDCPFGGFAAYNDAVILNKEKTKIVASHFRTFLVPQKTQSDYINSLKAQRHLVKEIRKRNGFSAEQFYPYSYAFVFFEQYLELNRYAVTVLSASLIAIFLINLLILGSFLLSFYVALFVLSTLFCLIGLMGWWNIDYNAISLVNLAIATGISVEFFSNIARSYLTSSGSRNQKVHQTLSGTGCSVFSGITLTKLTGVVVLAFATTGIFVVYYFRMYLLIVLLCFIHGLIVFPILLSVAGPTYVLTSGSLQIYEHLEEEEEPHGIDE